MPRLSAHPSIQPALSHVKKGTKPLWSCYLSHSLGPVRGHGIPLSFPLEGIKAEGSFLMASRLQR